MIDAFIASLDPRGSGLMPIAETLPWANVSTTTNLYNSMRWDSIPIAQILIAGLVTPQVNLDRDRLIWHWRVGSSKLPQIAQTPSGLMIVDGHHRLAVMWLRGVRVTEAHVVAYKGEVHGARSIPHLNGGVKGWGN